LTARVFYYDVKAIQFCPMPNILRSKNKTTAISMLPEGNSIRARRMTAFQLATPLCAWASSGEGCKRLMDAKLRIYMHRIEVMRFGDSSA